MTKSIHPKLIYADFQNLKIEELLWLKKIEQTIFQLSKNHLFNMEDLGKKMDLSRRQLQRRMKKITNLTPKEYAKEVRLLEALRLMKSGETKTVKSTAMKLGYTNSDYFSILFKKRFGIVPSFFLK